MTMKSNRFRTIGRLLAAVAFVAGALALLTFHDGGRSKAYNEGWDYVAKSVRSGSNVGQTGASFVDCDAAAAAAWHVTFSYGMQSPANHQNYSEWDQGCHDAVNWVQTSGLNGLQIPYY